MSNDVPVRAAEGRVRLAEIAAHAGVSEATVSRVINRRAGVSTKTRRSVEAAMADLGSSGRVLQERVMLLTPGFGNPFFGRMCEAVFEELSTYGLHPFICRSWAGSTRERDQLEYFTDQGVAAVVFLSSPNLLREEQRENRQLLAARGIPSVSLNGGFPDLPGPVFSTDQAAAGELAVTHLWDQGHRRLALLAGPRGISASDRRIAGFEDSMARRGVRNPVVLHDDYSFEGGRSGGTTLLDRHPQVTGVVAASDQIALGVIDAVKGRGLTVPGDVSVIGYDDAEVLQFCDPPLTTVRQPVELLAQRIGYAVIAAISGHPVEPVEQLIRPELTVRRSTALPRDLSGAVD